MTHDMRRATVDDIPRLQHIRAAVTENRLTDPGSVTQQDYLYFIGTGRVWVAVRHGQIAGFSASDARDGTIWALFVDPATEGQGLGPRLLALACDDLRGDGYAVARLSTDPGTRAARLYQRLGWSERGLLPDGEMQFDKAL